MGKGDCGIHHLAYIELLAHKHVLPVFKLLSDPPVIGYPVFRGETNLITQCTRYMLLVCQKFHILKIIKNGYLS